MDLQIIQNQLIEDGFRPSFVQGTINFKYEGSSFYIDTDPSDHMYLRIGYPGIYSVGFGQMDKAKEISGDLTRTVKGAKVYLHGDSVHCTIEQFLANPTDFRTILLRALGALQYAASQFREAMQRSFY